MKDLFRLIFVVCIRILLRMFYIFPVKKNRILFCAYNGNKYACNPKYIYEYIVGKYGENFEYLWVINNKSLILPTDIKHVANYSIKFFYYAMTSKALIYNAGGYSLLPLRKSQFFLNTWHGGGAYKKSQADIMLYFRNCEIKLAAKEVSAYISSNKKFSEVMSKAEFVPMAKMFEIGMPRNDIFFSDNSKIIANVKKYYNISEEKKLVLYAPTFRGFDIKTSNLESISKIKLDVSLCIDALQRRFSGNFVFLFRAHLVSFMADNKIDFEACIDASAYEDMQELLYASDILITDYSSSMWDFSLTGKPCFLYTPDLDQYDRERGFYTPIETWPGILCENNESLIKNIENFDEKSFAEKVKRHHDALGSCETGRASQIVGDKIYDICFGEK